MTTFFAPVREALLDPMTLTLPFVRESRRVGVIGLYQSGKTTFLTSLIAHFRAHDPHAFHLGKGVEVYPPTELEPEAGFGRFDFEGNRARLAREGRWPDKTGASTQYRADLAVRRDGRDGRVRLTLTDCPGERLADLPMAGRSYAEWSDWMLDTLGGAQHAGHARAILDATASETDDSEAMAHAYRETLALLTLAYTPIASPSYFLLDEGGAEVPPEARSLERLVAERFSGLSAGEQFTPMSAAHRERRPEMASVFAGRYAAYRERAVDPLARWLKRCHHLMVLVDVPMILAGGMGMLRAHAALIDQILAYADPGFGAAGEWVRRATAALGVPLAGVRRVTFVATKSDKVHPEDREKLDALLRQLVREPVRRHQARAEHLDIDYFICSAVRSTASGADGRLVGRLPGQGGDASFTVSRVPAAWPAEAWGAYRFASVKPRMPENEMYPPAHTGMHLVARAVLGLDA